MGLYARDGKNNLIFFVVYKPLITDTSSGSSPLCSLRHARSYKRCSNPSAVVSLALLVRFWKRLGVYYYRVDCLLLGNSSAPGLNFCIVEKYFGLLEPHILTQNLETRLPFVVFGDAL